MLAQTIRRAFCSVLAARNCRVSRNNPTPISSDPAANRQPASQKNVAASPKCIRASQYSMIVNEVSRPPRSTTGNMR